MLISIRFMVYMNFLQFAYYVYVYRTRPYSLTFTKSVLGGVRKCECGGGEVNDEGRTTQEGILV